jgi:hypothetical protein
MKIRPVGTESFNSDGRTDMTNLRRIFRKWGVGVWTGLSWLRIETVGGHL